jgi:hypothetical protein
MICCCEAVFAEAISTYIDKTLKLEDCFVAQNAPRKDIFPAVTGGVGCIDSAQITCLAALF